MKCACALPALAVLDEALSVGCAAERVQAGRPRDTRRRHRQPDGDVQLQRGQRHHVLRAWGARAAEVRAGEGGIRVRPGKDVSCLLVRPLAQAPGVCARPEGALQGARRLAVLLGLGAGRARRC